MLQFGNSRTKEKIMAINYAYTFKIIKLLRLKFHNTSTVTSFDRHLVNEHKTKMKKANSGSNSVFGLCCH